MAEGVAKMFTSQVEPPPIKPPSGKPASIESPGATHSLIPDAALYPVDLLGMKPVSENQPMLEVQHPAKPEPEQQPEKQATARVGLNMPRPEATFVRDVHVPDRWAAPQSPRSDRAEGWPDVRDASRF